MPHILIVCTANICRSPMGEVILRKELANRKTPGTWVIGSAGTWARAGLPAPEFGQQVMQEIGLDTRRHRSREVNSKILEQADLILTMEKGQKEAIGLEFLRVAGRIYLLSEMVGRQLDVADPFTGTLEDYRATAAEIQEYIQQGIEKIIYLAENPAAG